MSGEAQKYLEAGQFLTDGEREYLKTGESQYESQTRYRIRHKTKGALEDLCILNQYARPDDIEQIFHRENNQNAAHPSQEIEERPEPASNQWVIARHMVQLTWRGLRLTGVDKDDIFNRVIVRGIEDGEADYSSVPHGRVESEIVLNKLEAIEKPNEIDPVEKWERGISLSSDDIREIHNRLSDHPKVNSIIGEDIGDLIDKHLISE